MGNRQPIAKNVVDENISAIASVVNDAVQNCGQTVNQQIAQTVRISEGTIDGNLILDSENWLILKEGCIQSEQASTQLDQALQSAASQTASAIAQQFELNGAKAKNVIDINAQIASEIKNRFVQVCANESNQDIDQLVELSDTTVEGSVTLNAKNYQQSLVDCSTQSEAIDNLRNQLVIQIEQNASAKVENFFAPFFIALLIIIGLIALFLFLPKLLSKKKPTTIINQGDGASAALLAAIGDDGGVPPGDLGGADLGGGDVGTSDAGPSWADRLNSASTTLGKYKSQAEGLASQARGFFSSGAEAAAEAV